MDHVLVLILRAPLQGVGGFPEESLDRQQRRRGGSENEQRVTTTKPFARDSASESTIHRFHPTRLAKAGVLGSRFFGCTQTSHSTLGKPSSHDTRSGLQPPDPTELGSSNPKLTTQREIIQSPAKDSRLQGRVG